MSETPSFSAPVQLRKILRGRDVLGLAFGAMVGWGWVVLARKMIDRAGTLGEALGRHESSFSVDSWESSPVGTLFSSAPPD